MVVTVECQGVSKGTREKFSGPFDAREVKHPDDLCAGPLDDGEIREIHVNTSTPSVAARAAKSIGGIVGEDWMSAGMTGGRM